MTDLVVPSGRSARIAAVTAGLSVAGAVAGACVGLAMTLVTGGFHGPASVAEVLLSAAAVGAACGAVLFPL